MVQGDVRCLSLLFEKEVTAGVDSPSARPRAVLVGEKRLGKHGRRQRPGFGHGVRRCILQCGGGRLGGVQHEPFGIGSGTGRDHLLKPLVLGSYLEVEFNEFQIGVVAHARRGERRCVRERQIEVEIHIHRNVRR